MTDSMSNLANQCCLSQQLGNPRLVIWQLGWPIPALVGLAAGLALGQSPHGESSLSSAATVWFASSLLLGGLALLVRQVWCYCAALMLIAFAGLGILLGHNLASQASQDSLQAYLGQPISGVGVVTETPRGSFGGKTVILQMVECDAGSQWQPVHPVPHRLLLEIPKDQLAKTRYAATNPEQGELEVGQQWQFSGKCLALPVKAHPLAFDPVSWYASQGIHKRVQVERLSYRGLAKGWEAQRIIERLRRYHIQAFHGAVSPPVQGLVVGIMLGRAELLDKSLQEAFTQLGTSHLLAASGLNVGIVCALVFGLWRWLGRSRRVGVWPCLAAVWFYAALVGFSPSIVRASVMSSVCLLALSLGRPNSVWRSLVLAGLFILLARPEWLYHAGFQLSFAAVLGIVSFHQVLVRKMLGWPSWLSNSAALTIAATLGVLPLVVWHFQQLSGVALPANLLMTPAAELMLPLGFIAAWASLLGPTVAWLPMKLVEIAGLYLIWLAEVLPKLAAPWQLPRLPLASIVTYYLALALVRSFVEFPKASRWRRAAAVAALGLLLFSAQAVLLGQQISSPPGQLRIRVVRAGSGAWSWITSPSGQHCLVVSNYEPDFVASVRQVLRGYGLYEPYLVLPSFAAASSAKWDSQVEISQDEQNVELSFGQFVWTWLKRPRKSAVTGNQPSVLCVGKPTGLPASDPKPQLLVGTWAATAASKLSITQPTSVFDQHCWIICEQGPVEIFTDGRSLRWQLWSE